MLPDPLRNTEHSNQISRRSVLSNDKLLATVFVLEKVTVVHLDQVQVFPSNATRFNSCLLFYSNYTLRVSVVRPSSRENKSGSGFSD
jgi:hypothetical protein